MKNLTVVLFRIVISTWANLMFAQVPVWGSVARFGHVPPGLDIEITGITNDRGEFVIGEIPVSGLRAFDDNYGSSFILDGDIFDSRDSIVRVSWRGAGSIVGVNTLFVGSSALLTSGVSGGSWSCSNTCAQMAGNRITAFYPGNDTITYVFTNLHGTDSAIKIIHILATPQICVGASILFSDTATGGSWQSSNAAAAVTGGLVTGMHPGTDTINYIVQNLCGSDSAFVVVTILPLPYAGSIVGMSGVFVGSVITLSDSVTGGMWGITNSNATIANGMVTGLYPGTDTVFYRVTNLCGSDSALKYIQVGPMPDAGTIVGPSGVCVGSGISLTDSVAGGIWFCSNASATVYAGIVFGLSSGTDTIGYVYATDTAFKVIKVYDLPVVPIIDVNPPSALCAGTMFQNFGVQLPPPLNTHYNWSAVNAIIWAVGDNAQFALVNFPYPGEAYVTLTSENNNFCINSSSYSVAVSNSVAPIPEIFYFQFHFVCRPGDLFSYQWGYDDAITLDSNILPGEINQDYLNPTPDWAHKYYWVNTSNGECTQKTYYNAPVNITQVNDAQTVSMAVYPNPAKEQVNIVLYAAIKQNLTLEISNISGQKMWTSPMQNNKLQIDVSSFPAGFYLISCFENNIKIASSRFIKN